MLDYRIDLILQAWLMIINTFHAYFTILFILAVIHVLFRKYSPYSQFYIAGFMTIQTIWDGCPITDWINIFNNIGKFELTPNGFLWDFAGDSAPWYRLVFLLMSLLLYYNAYQTWEKGQTPLRFRNYFSRGTFKMEGESI
ncbi:MAG: hypothetical protein OHK0017_10250 [Patescibacteria group bacterium]